MAKNINNMTEGRTLDVIRKELVDIVDKRNLSTEVSEQGELEATMKKLVEDWNELSLLTAYADFLTDEHPLVAFGKAYTYATISTKSAQHKEVINGVKRSVYTFSVEDGKKMLSLPKFVAWAKERNVLLAADKEYLEQWGDAREEAIRQWKRYWNTKGETTKLEIGKMKKELQKLFDALVFIESSSGKNAIIATGDHAKWILGLSNARKVDLKTKTQQVNTMSAQLWETLFMDVWNMVCEKKTYTVIFGDEKPEGEAEETADTTTDTAEENTDNK